MILVLGAAAFGGHGRGSHPLPLAALLRDPEPFFAPQTPDLLDVDDVAGLAGFDMRTPIPPPGTVLGELAQPRPQRLVRVRHVGLVALGRTMLTDSPARAPLRHAQTILEHGHCGPSACR